MPAIRHLDRIRCTDAGPFGIRAGTVAAHDFDTRVLLQPAGERLRCPVGEEIRHLPLYEVNQYRAIGLAFAQRLVIYSQDLRCR